MPEKKSIAQVLVSEIEQELRQQSSFEASMASYQDAQREAAAQLHEQVLAAGLLPDGYIDALNTQYELEYPAEEAADWQQEVPGDSFFERALNQVAHEADLLNDPAARQPLSSAAKLALASDILSDCPYSVDVTPLLAIIDFVSPAGDTLSNLSREDIELLNMMHNPRIGYEAKFQPALFRVRSLLLPRIMQEVQLHFGAEHDDNHGTAAALAYYVANEGLIKVIKKSAAQPLSPELKQYFMGRQSMTKTIWFHSTLRRYPDKAEAINTIIENAKLSALVLSALELGVTLSFEDVAPDEPDDA